MSMNNYRCRMESLPFFNLFCSFIFISSVKLSLAAVDTISPGKIIRYGEGETLVSLSQSFELGFFAPGNSKYRYLGIWFKKSPETVVWVANRNSPIAEEGVFTISDNGNLVLLNETEDIVWSSNMSIRVENPVAKLLDTGNLVLMDSSSSSESYLWQSFDYPSDTMLPGMNLGRDKRTGVERYLTSWRNADDPSPGDYTYKVDINVLPQLAVFEGSMKMARTGPWNGAYFGGQAVDINLLFEPILVDNQDGTFFRYEYFNNPIMMLVKLNQSGKIIWKIWNERSTGWDVPYTGPENLCGNYGYCGANGVCNIEKTPSCECFKGFKPKAENSSRGCVANFSLSCEAGDGFIKLADIKLPDLLNVSLTESPSLEECENECLKSCSCRAYTNSSLTSGGNGCLMWYGDLIDIRYVHASRGAEDIYIRVPASELGTNPTDSTSTDSESGHKTNKGNMSELLIILIIIILFVTVVSLGSLVFYTRRKHRMKGEDLLQFDLEMNLNADHLEPSEVKKLGKSKRKEVKLPLFSFASVSAVTDNFSASNKLGEGGFGPVYKGTLLKGSEIAVKRLSRRSGQGWEELKNEAVLIANLRHTNLVRLLGCCTEQDEKILIYEYMPNRSLDILLFDPKKSWLLNWETRVQIIEGIAQGILYLHEYSGLRIIHRDLKASNILLDKDMNPKISDFGLARISSKYELQANRNQIAGTYGYMSPEYALQGIFSMKSDVFSFGVLLLEIVSGKKNTSFYQTDSLNLLGYVWDMWSSEEGLDSLDSVLEEVSSKQMLLRYIKIGLLCVQESAEDRPSMSEVVSMLGNESSPLPSPKQPGFSHLRNLAKSKSSVSSVEDCSTNELTITIFEAR